MEFFELDALAPTQYIHADGDIAILELATLDKELKFVNRRHGLGIPVHCNCTPRLYEDDSRGLASLH